MAAKQEFLKYGQSSKVDDLTKLALIDEKEFWNKVMEIRETIDSSNCQDIINLFGTESISLEDTAKNGILGVIPILLFLSTVSFY